MQTRPSSCGSDWVCPMLFLDTFAAPCNEAFSIRTLSLPPGRTSCQANTYIKECLGGAVGALKSPPALQNCCVLIQA